MNFDYCCDWLKDKARYSCPIHPRNECPDVIIHLYGANWGIPIHDGYDGGSSYYRIQFCPNCGSRLPRVVDNAR